ncbi:hypothetical protein ACFY0A_44685 [Streptomyces sp. NPDC001698]|uniref:hypothetical protein n=1 Tax=unclassified Streptomyces TaxID=2593676 RepID=UPI0036CD10C1
MWDNLSVHRDARMRAFAPPAGAATRDPYDGTHPNTSGEHRLAAAFADAMHQAWSLGGPYTAEAEQHG